MFIDLKSPVTINLEWLSYQTWTRQLEIQTVTWNGDPEYITRAELATQVAQRVMEFFEEMRDKTPDPSYTEYRSQPGVIDIDHLELVALKRVSMHSYIPHFRLITPPGRVDILSDHYL